MRRRAPAIIFALLLTSLTPGHAQSNLDTLFAQLRSADTGAAVISAERQIWSAWMTAGTPEQDQALARASAAMDQADFASAETQLNALIASAPELSEAWNRRATLYFLMGRYNESLADIETVLDLEPRHFGALSGRGMIFQRLGRNAEALAAFKDALAINPHMIGPKRAVQLLEQQAPEL